MIVERKPPQYEAEYYDGTFEGAKKILQWLHRFCWRAYLDKSEDIFIEARIEGKFKRICAGNWVVFEDGEFQQYSPSAFKYYFKEVPSAD